jgi:hypothetical protein
MQTMSLALNAITDELRRLQGGRSRERVTVSDEGLAALRAARGDSLSEAWPSAGAGPPVRSEDRRPRLAGAQGACRRRPRWPKLRT